jgi:hypothetical protein
MRSDDDARTVVGIYADCGVGLVHAGAGALDLQEQGRLAAAALGQRRYTRIPTLSAPIGLMRDIGDSGP